jgi:hypothetical protein
VYDPTFYGDILDWCSNLKPWEAVGYLRKYLQRQGRLSEAWSIISSECA